MSYANKRMLAILKASKAGFENSLANQSVLEKVSRFGFDSERLTKAFELNQKADKLFREKGTKTGQKLGINKEVSRKLAQCYELFIAYRKIFRKVYSLEPEILDRLQINNPVPKTIYGRIKMILEFYEATLKSETLLNKVSVFGLNSERLEIERQNVIAVEADLLEKGNIRMLDEKATQDRDKIFEELVREWGAYREVLKYCYLKEDGQFLEAFGIRVPTGGFYQRKKKNENEEVPENDTIPVDPLDPVVPVDDDSLEEDEDLTIEKCKEIPEVDEKEEKEE